MFANPKDGAELLVKHLTSLCGSEVIVYIDLCTECTKKAPLGSTWLLMDSIVFWKKILWME